MFDGKLAFEPEVVAVSVVPLLHLNFDQSLNLLFLRVQMS